MKRVVVFGGNGFVGSEIIKHLKGFDVYTADTHERPGKHLQRDIAKFGNVMSAIKKNDIVINLVGLTPTKKQKKGMYELVHVVAAKNLAAVCKERKAKLIQMSALGADPNATTEYLRTKGEAEKAIIESGADYLIIRPSIIFDRENELIKMMQAFSFTRFFPKFNARLQPIYRKDVARIFAIAAKGGIREKTIELGGPEKLTLFQMAKIIYGTKGNACHPIPLPLVKSGMIISSAIGFLGLGKDQITMTGMDNTTEKPYPLPEMTRFSEWAKSLK